MSLEDLHIRLDAHFSKLRAERNAVFGESPIFALEHGLGEADLKQLRDGICASVVSGSLGWQYWLPWVVYGAELGYEYTGEEYWQTFERLTPGWDRFGNRHSVRLVFKRFADEYGGARPAGKWAQHFSIICWPIVHGILPRDLQCQLAKVLYDLRYSLTLDYASSPEKLGRKIEGRSHHFCSRFQNLAQENLLVGQVAVALLFRREQLGGALILPDTLERIVSDLNKEGHAHKWLGGAKKRVERVTLDGLRRAGANAAGLGPVDTTASVREEVLALSVAPSFALRPRTEDCWDVVMMMPSFSLLAGELPEIGDVLRKTRGRLAGHGILSRGQLLYETERAIREWPQPGTRLIELDRPCPQLEALLSTEYIMKDRVIWLFKLTTDGLARELSGKTVRAGGNYLLLTAETSVANSLPGTPVSLSCAGAKASRVDLSDGIMASIAEDLESVGLVIGKSLSVWPAGITADSWDGEGSGHWLTTDRPCLGIRADFPVAYMNVALADSPVPDVSASGIAAGQTVFVGLPALPAGKHVLRITIRPTGESGEEEVGTLDLVVREPREVTPELCSKTPLNVFLDPISPTLEQLWEGHVNVTIRVPEGRSVQCRCSLHSRTKAGPLARLSLPPINATSDPQIWRRHFRKHFQDSHDETYDNADSCRIEFYAEELGTFILESERELCPLRWIVRPKSQRFLLRLQDDTGQDAEVSTTFYAFASPDVESSLGSGTCLDGIEADPAGGLYAASVGYHVRSVVVPPREMSLSDLIPVIPRIRRRPRRCPDCVDLVRVLSLWGKARIAGGLLAALRKKTILSALSNSLLGTIAGENWARAEQRFAQNPADSAIRGLVAAVRRYSAEEHAARDLAKAVAEFAGCPVTERVELFAWLVRKYARLETQSPNGVTEDWLAEFALRLATCDSNLAIWAGDHTSSAVQKLIDNPAILRLARILVLGIERLQSQNELTNRDKEAGLLHPDWEWD